MSKNKGLFHVKVLTYETWTLGPKGQKILVSKVQRLGDGEEDILRDKNPRSKIELPGVSLFLSLDAWKLSRSLSHGFYHRELFMSHEIVS